ACVVQVGNNLSADVVQQGNGQSLGVAQTNRGAFAIKASDCKYEPQVFAYWQRYGYRGTN
ncbi:MAG: hypothetical protein ABMA14_26295, partial [Hyphomonadaceae bacterium]